MKQLFAIFLGISCSFSTQAQDSVKIFSAYKFTLPGSALQTRMVPVEAGSFLMGSSENEKGREGVEGPQRKVTVEAFWMGAFEGE